MSTRIMISLLMTVALLSGPRITVSQTISQADSLGSIRVVVIFADSPSWVVVEKAPLKYNKKSAFSLQLDDGLKDAWSYAFQLAQGGVIGGIQYPGLFYTDGCGHDLNFTFSSSISSFSWYNGEDVHDPNTPYQYISITWPEIEEMYRKGWGISNHGVTSEAGDYAYSVARNHSYVKRKTLEACEGGIDMEIFVNTNGDINFSQYAFDQGYLACFRQGYSFGNPSFDVTGSWNPVNIPMGRSLLYQPINLPAIVHRIDSLSINGAHHWGTAFVHAVSDSLNGYSFDRFLAYMNEIAGAYGKSGADNMWIASEEEILNYLLVNKQLQVDTSLSGNRLEITLSGNIPASYRFYSTTLLISADQTVDSLSITGLNSISHTATGNDSLTLNLSWDGKQLIPPEEPAISWLLQSECSHSQKDANIAMDYILMMPEGTLRDEYRNRLCAIPGLEFPEGFCGLSTGETGESGRVILSPNPCHGSVILRNAPPNEAGQLTVYTLTGLPAGTHPLPPAVIGENLSVPVSLYDPGIYLLKAIWPSMTFSGKLIIR